MDQHGILMYLGHTAKGKLVFGGPSAGWRRVCFFFSSNLSSLSFWAGKMECQRKAILQSPEMSHGSQCDPQMSPKLPSFGAMNCDQTHETIWNLMVPWLQTVGSSACLWVPCSCSLQVLEVLGLTGWHFVCLVEMGSLTPKMAVWLGKRIVIRYPLDYEVLT